MNLINNAASLFALSLAAGLGLAGCAAEATDDPSEEAEETALVDAADDDAAGAQRARERAAFLGLEHGAPA